MSPQTKNELKSPTFLLSVAGMILAGAGWVFTLGMQSQRLDAATAKNIEQDARIEKLGDKVDAGFTRMADKIDGLRLELKK